MRLIRLLIVLFLANSLSACVFLSADSNYQGPSERPAALQDYYDQGSTLRKVSEKKVRVAAQYIQKRIVIESSIGETTIDFFQREEQSENLILVFPILGGSNKFANHFADYFAKSGFDSAVVHRDKGFKDPRYYEKIEDLLRRNVIRDRIAMDYFEEEHGKKHFASFGISRGAINAAVTSGVDPRLKYNVLAMGGSDLVSVFEQSDIRGIDKYIHKVTARTGQSRQEFFEDLRRRVKTDPKFVAPYIDAKNTLLILALFDRSVPIEYGFLLREQIGNPETILLFSGHFTSILYTQFISVFPPDNSFSLFPLDFVETEALSFYRRSFNEESISIKRLLLNVVKTPMLILSEFLEPWFN